MGGEREKIKRVFYRRQPRGLDLEDLVVFFLTQERFAVNGNAQSAIQVAIESLVNLSVSAENDAVRAVAASKILDFCSKVLSLKEQREAERTIPIVINPSDEMMLAIDKALSSLKNEDSVVKSE